LDEGHGPAAPAEQAARSPQGPARKLLVIVLNYNGIADTLDCLDSLRAQSCAGMATLVIDNGSRNDDLGRIAAGFPDVEVIALGENRGWAGGNNVGLRLGLERGFEYMLLLNNDTVLRADALQEMLAAAAAVGAPCLLHPVIHDFDDASRPQLLPGPAPATPDAAARRLAERHEVVEIDWAYGACLLIPAALARRIGLLDERFFLQLEEQDYFRRAVAAGMHSYCALRARILHKESVSFGGRVTPNKTYYQVRNSLLLAEKHEASVFGVLRALRQLGWALRHQARAVRPSAASRAGFLRWLGSGDAVARAVRQGVFDYLRRRFGARRVAPASHRVAPAMAARVAPPSPPVAPGPAP
jgi:GT2 family glycosyltransferase